MNNTIDSIEDLLVELNEFNEESTKIGVVKIKDSDLNKSYYEIVVQKSMNTKNPVLIIFKDITGDYRFNKSINKIKKREITMAKLAHELKNPISTIGLITDEINNRNIERRSSKQLNKLNSSSSNIDGLSPIKDDGFEEQDDQSVTIIYNLCNYLMILIEDLNAFVKLNNKEYNSPSNNNVPMQKIHLVDTLNFCYLIFYTKQKFDNNKQKLKVNIIYDEDVTELKVKTNEIKLKQLLINLLSNAYKFTVKGDITLIAKIISEDKDTNIVRVSVSDSGCGLTKEEQNSLFQPFKQIKKNQNLNFHGSGLGLTIVKEISKQLKFDIKINSIINVGTTFYFDIPYDKKLETFTKFRRFRSKGIFTTNTSIEILKSPISYIDDLFTRAKTYHPRFITKSSFAQKDGKIN